LTWGSSSRPFCVLFCAYSMGYYNKSSQDVLDSACAVTSCPPHRQ
jgi:hypothetical protein